MTAVNNTICKKYEGFIIKKQEEIGDFQTIYKFPNNYGASVKNSLFSQGLELAKLYFEGNTPYFSYYTKITNDVIGYIGDEQELTELLDEIKALKGGQ